MKTYSDLRTKEKELKEAPQKCRPPNLPVAIFWRVMDTITAEDLQVSVSIDEPKPVSPLQLESYYVCTLSEES